MNDFYRSTIESQRREISHLRTEQTSSNKRLKAYWVVGLAGWVLFVGALIWPVNAKASERHTMPETQMLDGIGESDDRIHKAPPGPDRANFRSATPAGFALAVFNANAPHLKRQRTLFEGAA